MKKYFISIAVLAFMAACGGGESTENKDEAASEAPAAEAPATTDVTQNPDYKAGLDLIAKSDCYTCHKTAEKLIGPSYLEVSQKYAGADTALAYLTHKIIAGGQGVWGTIPMTGHPALSQADAETMVKYILLIKDAQ